MTASTTPTADTPNSGLSALEALRLVRAILADKGIGKAPRLALAAAVAAANSKTRLTWPTYRTFGKKFGLASATVRAAMEYGTGRYLTVVGRGKHGSLCYRVRVNRTPASASASEAPALQPVKRGASLSEAICTYSTRASVREKKKRRPKAAAHPDHQRFIDWFAEVYLTTYGVPYVFAGGKDGRLVSDMLTSVGGNGDALAALKAAAQNMFADPWGHDHASIGTLNAQLNNWLKPAGGRAARKPKGGFTPAPARPGESYAGIERHFE